MSVEVLVMLVRRRIAAYLGSGADDLVLGAAASREAEDLWRAAQDDGSRQVLGELHCLRYFALPDGPDHLELARAVVVLRDIAHRRSTVPERLRIVLGAAADPHVQAAEGARLMNDAMTNADPVFLEAAVVLLTAGRGGPRRDTPPPGGQPEQPVRRPPAPLSAVRRLGRPGRRGRGGGVGRRGLDGR